MGKKFLIIIGIIAVIAIAVIFINKKSSATVGEKSKWDLSKGSWTEAQREAALSKLTNDWFPHIISQKWTCVKEKNAEKLVNDSIYQISLAASNGAEYGFPVSTYNNLLTAMKDNGVYDLALADAESKLK